MNKKLDISQIIGFLLIGAIIIYFTVFNQPEVEQNPAVANTEDTTGIEEAKVPEEELPSKADLAPEEAAIAKDSLQTDSIAVIKAQALYGPFAQQMLAQEETEFITLENDLLRLKFSTIGAQIVEAELKKYKTYDSLPLYLIKENSNFAFNLQSGQLRSSADIQFSILDQGVDFIDF